MLWASGVAEPYLVVAATYQYILCLSRVQMAVQATVQRNGRAFFTSSSMLLNRCLPTPCQPSLHEHAPSRSGEHPPSLGHIPPAPSTHLHPRMPRDAAAHCPYSLPVTLPSPFAGDGAPSPMPRTIILAAIDVCALSCECSCSLMLVAVLVCGAGAQNVCCMHT